MPRNRRPRRQGVVYGPTIHRDRSPDGGLMGRVVGMLVVLGAVAVLGVGALTFVGGNPPSSGASPGPTGVAGLSPTPRIGPTPPPPRPSPSPAPSPSPTPQPSPEPTPFNVEVREGPGYITFGTESNSNLRITDARTTFELGERITLSAQLIEPTGSAAMVIHFYKYDPEAETEEFVAEQTVRPRVASASTFLRNLRPSNALDGPGIYVMRYLRGDDVMSEGWLEVTD